MLTVSKKSEKNIFLSMFVFKQKLVVSSFEVSLKFEVKEVREVMEEFRGRVVAVCSSFIVLSS